jgi:5-methylcytosine-specific restriction endonuclease McrA
MECIECKTPVKARVTRCLPCYRIDKARKNCKTDGCASLSIAKGLCPKHYSAWRMAKGNRIQYEFLCRGCGNPGSSYNTRTLFHQNCQKRYASLNSLVAKRLKFLGSLSNSKELVLVPKVKKAPATPTIFIKGSFWWAGRCVICHKNFVSEFGYNTCSNKCHKVKVADRKRQNKNTRRARQKKAFVERVSPKKVFDSNGWICQICFEPVDPDSKDVNTRATLDHVIPLAKGGKHSYANTQLAHGLCNSTKRDLLDYRMV